MTGTRLSKKEVSEMIIRRAEEKDIEGILKLLSQVLEVHAAIRPDLFISGRTKYTHEELSEMVEDDSRPIYVALENESDEAETENLEEKGFETGDSIKNSEVLGYAFCILKEEPGANCVYPHNEVYIDDLCVDEFVRGKDVAKEIYEFVKKEASAMGYDYLTLNVWEGNVPATKFYQKMGMTPRKTMMECKL